MACGRISENAHSEVMQRTVGYKKRSATAMGAVHGAHGRSEEGGASSEALCRAAHSRRGFDACSPPRLPSLAVSGSSTGTAHTKSMAHLAACCTRALCASPLHAQRNTVLARRGCVRGLAAAARPPPPADGGGASGGGASRPPSARELARQLRVRLQAEEARLEVQRRASYGRAPPGLSADEQTSRQIEAAAVQLLGAGMTRAGVVDLLLSRPNIVSLEP